MGRRTPVVCGLGSRKEFREEKTVAHIFLLPPTTFGEKLSGMKKSEMKNTNGFANFSECCVTIFIDWSCGH